MVHIIQFLAFPISFFVSPLYEEVVGIYGSESNPEFHVERSQQYLANQAVREKRNLATNPMPQIDLEKVFPDKKERGYAQSIISQIESRLQEITADQIPAQERHITIQPDIDEELNFQGDREGFTQVLTTLIENDVIVKQTPQHLSTSSRNHNHRWLISF